MNTKGPWYIHKLWNIKGNDQSTVAKIIPWDETGCREEDHSNARLIAAAPDLLETLKTLYIEEKRDDDDPILIAAREQAKQAIAKAERG